MLDFTREPRETKSEPGRSTPQNVVIWSNWDGLR